MSEKIRFRVRPVYHGTDLLIELIDDHREPGFPSVASILGDALRATQIAHPEGLDDPTIGLSQDRYFSFWSYSGGTYEIDDDIWAFFVSATANNKRVTSDIERALLSTGRFVKEAVDFKQFR